MIPAHDIVAWSNVVPAPFGRQGARTPSQRLTPAAAVERRPEKRWAVSVVRYSRATGKNRSVLRNHNRLWWSLLPTTMGSGGDARRVLESEGMSGTGGRPDSSSFLDVSFTNSRITRSGILAISVVRG